MARVSKATKKFQSKKLKTVLKQRTQERRHDKKIQGRRGNKTEQEKSDIAGTKQDQKMMKSVKDEVFRDMSVEKFFEKDVELPKESKKLKLLKRQTQLEKEKLNKEMREDSESSSEEEGDEEMKKSMKELAEKDPDFYKYLEENDKDLLNFEGENPLDAIPEDDDEEDEDEEMEEPQKKEKIKKSKTETSGSKQIELTSELIKKWKSQLLEKPSFKNIRNITIAFKMTVNSNKDESTDDYKYSITNGKVLTELMFLALKDLPKAVQKLSPYKLVKGARTLPNSSNVAKLSSLVKNQIISLLVLLNDSTNTKTITLVLHSLNQLFPHVLSYRRILKEVLKTIVNVWSTTTDLDTQLASFAFLHSISKEFKKSTLELVLKATYSTFIKNCRKTNVRTMPLINFQKNSAAELFDTDETLGYQVGFEYIRQLAIHLRNSTKTNSTKPTSNKSTKSNKNSTNEAYKIVYNWQFCHSLDFWSRVLSFSCNPQKENGHDSQLRQLIYPLVQITLGVIRLIPTPQFFPLRFYLIRSLIRLSQNTGVFIPIFPLLSEILTSTAFTKPAKKDSNPIALDFENNIKCSQAYLGTKIYQDGLSEQFVDLLGEYFGLYSKSVSFPELVTPAIISLRRYMKTSKNVKLNKQLTILVNKLNQNSNYIQDQRSNLDFGPGNKGQVSKFLTDISWEKTPLGAYVAIQKEVKEEKAEILRKSIEDDEIERKEQEKKKLAQDEEAEDDDEDMSDA